MGLIPKEFIDELLSRADIVEVIDARVPLKKSGREYSACCPFHEEKTPSFTVSPAKQFYHCFGCGAHGTAIGFLMEYEHLDFVEAVYELARAVGLTVPRTGVEAPAAPVDQDSYALLQQAAEFYRKQLREHAEAGRAVEYLKGRGLTGEIAAEYGVGYTPSGWSQLAQAFPASHPALVKLGLLVEKESGGVYDRFRERVMFPIHDQRGRVIGFGGRVLGKEEPKYLNSPESPVFHKGRELYGLYQARKSLRKIERLLVVEGYMDVLALAQYGIRNVVATLGTATTREHLERIFRVAPEAVFCFDGDRAGREAAWRALEAALPLMHEGRQARFLFLPEGEDPDTLVRKEGRAAFEARVGQTMPLSDFLYEGLAKQTDIKTMDGRARLVELSRALLGRLPEGVYRHMMVTRLSEIVHISADILSGLLGFGAAVKPPRSGKRQGIRRLDDLTGGAGAPMSPVRRAIALLLQRPALAKIAGEPRRLAGTEIAGVDILVSLLELLQAQPHLNTAALLERGRDLPHGRYLLKLAQWRPLLKEEEWQMEFLGALAQIGRQGLEERREHLISKSRIAPLSAEEKRELAQLLSTPPDQGRG
jgi:DNA primase